MYVIKKENITWKLTVVNKFVVSRSISLSFMEIFISFYWKFRFFSFLGFSRAVLHLNLSNFVASSLVLFPALYPVARH